MNICIKSVIPTAPDALRLQCVGPSMSYDQGPGQRRSLWIRQHQTTIYVPNSSLLCLFILALSFRPVKTFGRLNMET